MGTRNWNTHAHTRRENVPKKQKEKPCAHNNEINTKQL